MRGRAFLPTGGFSRLGVGWFAPILLVSVFLLIACIGQRFSVSRKHQENIELRGRLVEVGEEIRRAEAKVESLACRERIERIAAADFELYPPGPGEQVFLPVWRADPAPPALGGSLAAGIIGTAGRGIDHLRTLFGGPSADGGNR